MVLLWADLNYVKKWHISNLKDAKMGMNTTGRTVSTKHLWHRQRPYGRRQDVKRLVFHLSLNIVWAICYLFHSTCKKSQQTQNPPVLTAGSNVYSHTAGNLQPSIRGLGGNTTQTRRVNVLNMQQISNRSGNNFTPSQISAAIYCVDRAAPLQYLTPAWGQEQYF